MVRYSLRHVVHNILCVEILNVVHLWRRPLKARKRGSRGSPIGRKTRARVPARARAHGRREVAAVRQRDPVDAQPAAAVDEEPVDGEYQCINL